MGIEGKLKSVGNAHFLVYTIAMGLDRLFAYVKLLGDFLVSVTVADKADYLSFSSS